MLTSSNTSARLILNNVTESFVITDLTDYVAASVAPADVTIFAKVELATSEGTTVLYDNITTPGSPDITPSTSSSSTGTIPIEQDGDGRPVQGTYILTLQYVVVGAPEYNVTYTASHELSFTYPSVSISTETNCAASTLKGVDDTDYNGGSILNRVFTIYPPAGAKYQDGTDAVKKTTPLNVIIYGPNFFTGLYNISLYSEVQWALENTFYLIDTVEGDIAPDVVCDTNLCELMCCVNSVNKELEAIKLTNYTKYLERLKDVQEMMRYFLIAVGALQCGNSVILAEARQKVLDISGCENCGCTSDKPVLIIPTQSAAGEFVVTSTNGTISVQTTVDGSLTTFNLAVSQSIINQLNSLHNTVVQSSDINITSSEGADGTITYILSLPANLNRNPNINLNLRVENLGAGWVITPLGMQYFGSNVKNPSTYTYVLGDKNPGAPTNADAVFLKVSDFFTALQTFTCSANVIKYDFTTPRANIATTANITQIIKAEIFYYTGDVPESDVYVRIVKPDGTPFLFADMPLLGATTDTQKIDINLQITPQA